MLSQPNFGHFNQFGQATSPAIYSSPPQIFYWAGFPSGPISPTYIQPLPIPPHAFTHFPTDRTTLVCFFYISYMFSHFLLTQFLNSIYFYIRDNRMLCFYERSKVSFFRFSQILKHLSKMLWIRNDGFGIFGFSPKQLFFRHFFWHSRTWTFFILKLLIKWIVLPKIVSIEHWNLA
jgi:hypothetical protein